MQRSQKRSNILRILEAKVQDLHARSRHALLPDFVTHEMASHAVIAFRKT
jgi:hypothetical protein